MAKTILISEKGWSFLTMIRAKEGSNLTYADALDFLIKKYEEKEQ
jgi:hypothetical protein